MKGREYLWKERTKEKRETDVKNKKEGKGGGRKIGKEKRKEDEGRKE